MAHDHTLRATGFLVRASSKKAPNFGAALNKSDVPPWWGICLSQLLRKSDYDLYPTGLLSLTEKTMPIHFKVASHDAQPFERVSHLTKPEELLTQARTTRCAELLQSSFVGKGVDLSTVFGTANGFVDTVTTAYNRHHHLIFKFVDLLHVSLILYWCCH